MPPGRDPGREDHARWLAGADALAISWSPRGVPSESFTFEGERRDVETT